MVKCEIKLRRNNFKIISAFYFTRNHVGNYFKIISAAFIILFQRLIAAHEYFPTCSVLRKLFWNNFRALSAAETLK